MAEGRESLAHDELVLGVHERSRPGPDSGEGVPPDPLEDRRGHVLVVEGEDVHLLGEPAHGGLVVVASEPHPGGDGGGALGRIGGEHLQLEAQLDRGAKHHAGQLARAHHPDPADEGALGRVGRIRA